MTASPDARKSGTARRRRAPRAQDFPVVGIGASAGGLAALSELLRALPPEPGMAFVIVTHLDPQHASILDTLLARESSMPIHPVVDGTAVRPNHAYVVTPDKAVTISGGVLRTRSRALERTVTPTVIDGFLASLAQDQHGRARGVVLSGIGSDGTEGLKLIRIEGGVTFAQDPRSAEFDSMPSSAIRAGCVDFIDTPAGIARRLIRLRHMPELELERARKAGHGSDPFREILAAVLRVTGTDFSENRAATLHRRIARRMALKHLSSLAAYARHVRQDADEARALHADLFIHVSSFFRDPNTFAALERHAIRDLVSRRTAEPLRVWVAGCSKGEEVYSLGMQLLEALGSKARRRRLQLFGTDIDAGEINAARAGRFPASIAADVSPRRLKRFFVEVPGGYAVGRELRDACVFATQDITSDPPFSKLDLISCRNVLMYFTRPLQARMVAMFHYALRPGGYLLLGHSETVGGSSLFTLVDRKHRIYARKDVPNPPPWHAPRPTDKTAMVARPAGPPPTDLRSNLDRMLAERYAPPGFFVDHDLQVQAFQGDVGALLQPAAGHATLHLSRLVPPALALDIRTAIRAARRARKAVPRETSIVAADGTSQPMRITVIPVARDETRKAGHLVLFERRSASPTRDEEAKAARPRPEVARLRRALTSMREQMQTLVEEREASEQELRTAHEEVLSSNEELQSANEELETGKEEMQSANEELTTVNEELQRRNEELDRLTAELSNLIAGINIPIVNLDRERRVLRFSPAAQSAFNLIPADVGRSFSHIKPPVIAPDLDELIADALRRGASAAREVQDSAGRWHVLRLLPYRGADQRVDGVLITLVDIDAAKRRAAAVVETIREPLLVLDAEFRVLGANPAFLQAFHLTARDVEGQPLFKLAQGQWDFPELRRLIQDVLPRHRHFQGFRLEHSYPQVGRKVFLLNGQQIFNEGEGTETILLAFLDVTEQERAAQEVRDLAARLRDVREQEDKRVAHDLHDLSSEGLAGLSIELARLEKLAASAPDEAAQGLKRARQRVRELAQSTHEMARRLHPAILDDLGLARALHAECRALAVREGIKVSAQLRPLPRDLPEPVALCAYRVVQEALRNVARHASARTARVAVRVGGGQLRLTVRDDGAGFDVAAARAKGGLGLFGMEDRVAAVRGRFHVKSGPGRGTTVTAEIPLEKKRRAGEAV